MKFLTGEFSTRNIMPLNIYYSRGLYNVYDDDLVDIVYKDLDTGKKYVETIQNPLIEVWIVKPEFRNFTHIRNFIKKDQCISLQVHYKSRFREIGQATGITTDEAKISPYVCQADMKIEHFYLMHFILEYPTTAKKSLSLGYLDIESDIIRLNGFPNPGETPTNAVTYIDDSTKTVYTLILAKDHLPELPKEHKEFARIDEMRVNFYEQVADIQDHMDDFFKELHELFDESYGVFEFKLEFFDDEITMMNSLWTIIRNCDTDYSLVWNLPYDAQNLIERVRVLGYDPATLIVDDRFGTYPRTVSFTEDRNPLIQKRRHVCDTYSATTFVDLMVEYVGIRAGRGKIPSAKLNAVAKAELKDSKLDYSEDANIKTLFYVNFRKFIKYNIKDVLLMVGIEHKTHDMDTVYSRLYSNYVLLNESFVTTAVVLNSLRTFAYTNGEVMGFNKNKFAVAEDDVSLEAFLTDLMDDDDDDLNDDDALFAKESEEDESDDSVSDVAVAVKKDDKFDGAFVMNTNHMTSTGFEVMGRAIKFIHNLMVDLDIRSEYPTAFIIMNASNETIVAKVMVDNPKDVAIPMYKTFEFKNDERRRYKDDPGNFFVEVLSENDPFNFGELFLHLPGPAVILAQVGEDYDSLKK